jgi:hypothetical protein
MAGRKGKPPLKKSVLLVSGSDRGCADRVIQFLNSLGLFCTELSSLDAIKSSSTQEDFANSISKNHQAVVVLLTPEDRATLDFSIGGENNNGFQPNPEIILLLGMLMVRSESFTKQVIVLQVGDIRYFNLIHMSDSFKFMQYIQLNEISTVNYTTRGDLIGAFKIAGCEIASTDDATDSLVTKPILSTVERANNNKRYKIKQLPDPVRYAMPGTYFPFWSYERVCLSYYFRSSCLGKASIGLVCDFLRWNIKLNRGFEILDILTKITHLCDRFLTPFGDQKGGQIAVTIPTIHNIYKVTEDLKDEYHRILKLFDENPNVGNLAKSNVVAFLTDCAVHHSICEEFSNHLDLTIEDEAAHYEELCYNLRSVRNLSNLMMNSIAHHNFLLTEEINRLRRELFTPNKATTRSENIFAKLTKLDFIINHKTTRDDKKRVNSPKDARRD